MLSQKSVKERMNRAYRDLFGEVVRGLRRDGGISTVEHKEGSYPFIPMDTDFALRDFIMLHSYLKGLKSWSGHSANRSKFLDAGCGVGNIMMLARVTGLCQEVHGIEFFDKTYEQAKLMLGLFKGNRAATSLFKDDILKFDKYGNYDIIYYYCPFCDHRLEAMFEERVEDQMKLGAILLPRLKRNEVIKKDYRFREMKAPGVSQLFMKIKDGERKVTMMGKEEMEFRRGDGRFEQEFMNTIAEKYELSLKD